MNTVVAANVEPAGPVLTTETCGKLNAGEVSAEVLIANVSAGGGGGGGGVVVPLHCTVTEPSGVMDIEE